MGDKDNMMFGSCNLFYCNKPIETGIPIATVDFDLSNKQSDDEKEKWDNQCGHTITYEVKVKKLTNKENSIFYGKYWKLPRKLKKMVKHRYFLRYPKRISHNLLTYVYLLNNPKNNI